MLLALEGSVNLLTMTLRSTYCCLTSSLGPFAYMSVDLECINDRAADGVSRHAEHRRLYHEGGVFVESHCLLDYPIVRWTVTPSQPGGYPYQPEKYDWHA